MSREVLHLPGVPPILLVERLIERAEYPRRIAERFMDSPQLVLEATIFYFDCDAADEGDPEAKHRVDNVRESVQAMRTAERALGNDPDIGSIVPTRGRVGMPEPIKRPEGLDKIKKRDLPRGGPSIHLPYGVRGEG